MAYPLHSDSSSDWSLTRKMLCRSRYAPTRQALSRQLWRLFADLARA
jgi:hypothetical protein